MNHALQTNHLIEKYSIQLLKLSLSADQKNFWKLYDQLLNILSYVRIQLNGQTCIISKNQAQMYENYEESTKKKISKVQLLQNADKKRFWHEQKKDFDQFSYSNSIYCILTPLNFIINSEIHQKRNDFGYASYAFVSGDYVVFANKQAQKKGILKGLPVLLVRQIDVDTKIIEINKYTNNKFDEIYEIFSSRYKNLDTQLKNQQIHFTLSHPVSEETFEEYLRNKLKNMLIDIYEVCRVKMFAFVSKNQLLCQLFINDTSLKLIENKSFQPVVLIDKQSVQEGLSNVSILSIPGMGRNISLLLNSFNIKSVKDLLENLHLLEIITSPQQAQIFLQTCLGIDHRQTQAYLEEKKRQFLQFGLNYEESFPKERFSQIQSLKRQNERQIKADSLGKDFDQYSLKSETLPNVAKRQGCKVPKSEKNHVKPSQSNSKQQFFPLFGKKTKK